MTRDLIEEFHSKISTLRMTGHTFAVATVIETIGSASARVSSKAIFSDEGKNLMGWVGGGCAERFIGEEAVAAIKEAKPRTILADLDDEIFGLGVACGGKMKVFIEPIVPPEMIFFPENGSFQQVLRGLSFLYGIEFKTDHSLTDAKTMEELLLQIALAIGKKRARSCQALREIKNVPATFLKSLSNNSKQEVTIVGRTRITEALARHFALLGFSIRAIGPDLKAEDYPESVQCQCLKEGYSDIKFREGEVVIIAAHTAQDPVLVKAALTQKARHVAMIGSYKRSLEVLTYLNLLEQEIPLPLFIPAGLDIDARNPDEVALSVIAEVIQESRSII